ncbi:MAG: DEAD/DEAH box helicase [Phycisphaeraceae bacterium]
MSFSDLRLIEPILRAIRVEGYDTPTPIQAQTIPHILEGKDVLGSAQTGTGKTAAFALPLLHRLHAPGTDSAPGSVSDRRLPRCLVLAPTRELACQIADSFATYGRYLHLKQVVIFGGVSQNPQVNSLKRGVDIIIATPGRLLDLMNQRHVNLANVQTLVLDEADRMLDMGFIPDIKRITAALPKQRQTLLFSATMPGAIRHLADDLLHQPVNVRLAPPTATADGVDQSVFFVPHHHKTQLLTHLLGKHSIQRAIVFTRTKHRADKVVRHLNHSGHNAEAIHSNKSQNARTRSLDGFRTGKINVLVATDIASRGIDVDGITHVINFDLTHDPESYVHRIGRTARAGAAGVAWSFCDKEEWPLLAAVQRLIKTQIPVSEDQPQYTAAEVGLTHAPAPGNGSNHHGEHHADHPPRKLGSRNQGPQKGGHHHGGPRKGGPARGRGRSAAGGGGATRQHFGGKPPRARNASA